MSTFTREDNVTIQLNVKNKKVKVDQSVIWCNASSYTLVTCYYGIY